MAATAPSASLGPVQPVFTDAARLALAGYLAGCRGLAREACTLDLRQFTAWCRTRSLPLFSVRRPDIETFARDRGTRGAAHPERLRDGQPREGAAVLRQDEGCVRSRLAGHCRVSRACPVRGRVFRQNGGVAGADMFPAPAAAYSGRKPEASVPSWPPGPHDLPRWP